MTIGTSHRFRVVILAAAGITLTLAIMIGILVNLSLRRSPLTLADRIDREQTVLYVSTTDRRILLEAIHRYRAMLPDAPAETLVPEASHYEFAILQTASGSLSWIIESVKEGREQPSLLSRTAPPLLAIAATHRRSLSAMPLFAHIPEERPSFVWFNPRVLPLPRGASADLVRAVLSPLTEGMLLFTTPGHGTLLVRGKGLSRVTFAPQLPEPSLKRLLGLSFGDPIAVQAILASTLSVTNPGLSEGIQGMLQAALQRRTGSTDVRKMTDELLSGPLTIAVERGEADALRFAIAGVSSTAEALTEWLTALNQHMSAGTIRRRDFNEFTRIDVALTLSEASSARKEHGWTLTRLGGSGADLALTSAVSGRAYILGTDDEIVERLMKNDDRSPSNLGSGTLDLPWFTSELERGLPFLLPLASTMDAILGTSASRISWTLQPLPGGVRTDWQID